MLYATLVVLSSALLLWLHTDELKTRYAETASRSSAITGTLAAHLDGSWIPRLLTKYESPGAITSNTQDPWYYVLQNTLEKASVANELSGPLVIVVQDPVSKEMIEVVNSTAVPTYRQVHTGSVHDRMIAYLKEQRVDGQRILNDAAVVTFDPVRDNKGRIMGLLVHSTPTEVLRKEVNAALWKKMALLLVFLILLAVLLFRSVGKWVKDQESAHSDLRQKHEGITDSIAYASKIQKALVPRPEQYREMFPDHFVLDRPKDVVSGDFHWFHRIDEDICFVAAADCTGHGLPGAMMAAIGCSLLNELVQEHPHMDPAEMLHLLNRRMVRTMNQDERSRGAGDGMDVALCRIDRAQKEILFAGAFRPLYWMHDAQLTVINGDRRPVGGSQHDPERTFTVHRVAYHPGDRIYLFSDGYVDQFGGPEGRKFMTERFNSMLVANQHLPLSGQREVLEQAFARWMGTHEQIDDVCVLGLEV